MISVEKLSNYLSVNDDEIEEIKPFSIPQLEKEERHIYDKYVLENKFEFLNKEIHSIPSWVNTFFGHKNYFMLMDSLKENTFCSAVLNCIMPDFRHLDKQSRRSFMKDLFKQMCYDLGEKKLYQEYGYNKNHKFSNQDLTKSLQNFTNIDDEKYNYVKQYIADYFSLSIYIFSKSNLFGKEYKVDCIKHNETVEIDKLNPTLFLIKINNSFYPVLEEDNNGIFLYTNHKIEIDNINNEKIELKKKYTVSEKVTDKKEVVNSDKKEVVNSDKKEVVNSDKKEVVNSDKKENFNKMKLEELQKYAIDQGIDIYKVSAKTKKKIKKTIKELKEML